MTTIADITVNGHTYTDADWRADWEGTISSVANDIATVQTTLDAVGTLSKTVSGDTTLSGTEGQNLLFVIDGSISANAAITFPSGFKGLAGIVNATSGGYALVCGLASGNTATVPTGGTATLYCDGTDFGLLDGIVQTSTGVSAAGALAVGGAATFGSTVAITGAATVGGAITVTGAATLSSTLAVSGAATVGGAASVTGVLTAATSVVGGSDASFAGDGTFGGDMAVTGTGTFSGSELRVTGDSGDSRMHVDADAGQSAFAQFDANATQRWLVGRNNTTETGSDVGSDFDIVRADDSGSPIGIPLHIRRSDGVIVLGELPTSASGLPSGALWLDTVTGGGNWLRTA